MLNNARKQRLTREALGNADGEMPTAKGTVGTIAIFVLILFAATALSGFHRDDRKIVTASATDRNAASVHDDSPMLKKQDLAAKAKPEGNAQQQGEENLIQIYSDWIQAEHGRVGLYAQDALTLKKQYLAGNAEPEGKEQQRGTEQQQGEASKKEPEGNVQDLTY
jgi:hypothetical protein